MKALGYLLLIGGFLGGAFATALDTQQTDWAIFWPAAVVAVAGLLTIKRQASGIARSEAVLTANRAELGNALGNVVALLDEWRRNRRAPARGPDPFRGRPGEPGPPRQPAGLCEHHERIRCRRALRQPRLVGVRRRLRRRGQGLPRTRGGAVPPRPCLTAGGGDLTGSRAATVPPAGDRLGRGHGGWDSGRSCCTLSEPVSRWPA